MAPPGGTIVPGAAVPGLYILSYSGTDFISFTKFGVIGRLVLSLVLDLQR